MNQQASEKVLSTRCGRWCVKTRGRPGPSVPEFAGSAKNLKRWRGMHSQVDVHAGTRLAPRRRGWIRCRAEHVISGVPEDCFLGRDGGW